MRSIGQYLSLLQHLGPGWVLYRVGYAVRRKAGFLRRSSPAVPWRAVPAPVLSPYRVKLPEGSPGWGEDAIGEAEKILCGEFTLFSHRVVKAGFPPDWRRNQLTEDGGKRTEDGGRRADVRHQSSEEHWTEISDSSGGDIKGVWELNRFAWAYPLVRAYARTHDERFPAAFWWLFDDWCRHNPPNLGPNWMCGQEATFRVMAVVFAAEGFGVPEERQAALARFVVATGRRIAANLDYALSQKNNHGISECVGLITVALLLPIHGPSAGWLALGLSKLEAQCSELIYEDGGFAQHSLIYHRVLLHDLCWCRRRLELAGQKSPAWLDAAGKRALDFLMILTDPYTGQAPVYGSNDGANVLPLCDADFLDMRPVIQMAAAVLRGEMPLPAGPWDEAPAWLKPDWDLLPRVPWPTLPPRWHAPVAGCFQLAEGRDRLFLRCPTRFRHRPGHADMMHVDIWHSGRPIAMDGGSFSYNSPERFTALGTAVQHNVLTVDGIEPMKKFSRFLYLPWPIGEASDRGNGVFQASHNGYAPLGIEWTREVSMRVGGGFFVRDNVRGAEGHKLTWHWRLADVPLKLNQRDNHIDASVYRIAWTGLPEGSGRLLRADETTATGWWSKHYGAIEPAMSLVLEAEARGDVELVTEFSPIHD